MFFQQGFANILSRFAMSILLSGLLLSQAQAETILLGGTGSSLGGMKLVSKAFMKKHPEHRVVVLPSLGSGGGIKALKDKKIDLALSARPLKTKEQHPMLHAFKYADTPLVIVTRKDNEICSTTLDILVKLYEGKQSQWPDGGTVRIVRRPHMESDIKILRSISSDMKHAVNKAMRMNHLPIALNDQENAILLERLPGSLGVITLAQMLSEKRILKEITLDGVNASINNISNGKYKYYKSLYIVKNKQTKPAVTLLLNFIASEEGQNILRSHGHLVRFRKVV